MSIEKDLQQKKPFKNEQEKCLVNILFTSRYIENVLSSAYKEYGITMKQYNILRILKGASEPISTQLIRERMIDRMSDISRIVDRLVEKNLVTKCVNGTDKRLVDVTLSESGLNLLEEVKHSFDQNNYVTNNLNNKEAEDLSRLLDKIRGY
jgi:DNA-binding MarR family transcriptional regulator